MTPPTLLPPRRAGDSVGVVLLVVFSVLFAIAGFVFSSNATSGTVTMAFACLLAIFARIAQAGRQHEELLAPRRQAQAPPVPELSPAEREERRRRERRDMMIAGAAIALVMVLAAISALLRLN